MSKFKGFYIDSKFLNREARSLTSVQLGILVKLFELLTNNSDKKKWGFLVDDVGQPLSERKIRYYCGGGAIMPHKTWNGTKTVFLKEGMLEQIRVKGVTYLYSPPFIKMNPRAGLLKRESVARARKAETEDEKTSVQFSKDYFLGYDVDDARPDTELDTWERLCRRWIELTWDEAEKAPLAPFPLSWNLGSKEAAKKDMLALVAGAEIEQVLHDMSIAFDYKRVHGGEITTLTFFITRWMARDWRSRRVPKRARKRNRFLQDEIKLLVKNGAIKTKTDLFEHFPRADKKILGEIAKGLKL